MGDQPMRLPCDQRQELIGFLAGEGWSTRAIAPIVGASDFTVREDIKAGARNLALSRLASSPPSTTRTGEILDSARKITGLDGNGGAVFVRR